MKQPVTTGIPVYLHYTMGLSHNKKPLYTDILVNLHSPSQYYPYLASLLHFSNIPRQLRSSTSQQLSIPRTKLNLCKRAFSAAPIIWKELLTTLKSCESLACLTIEVTNVNFHGVHRLELYIVAFFFKSLHR